MTSQCAQMDVERFKGKQSRVWLLFSTLPYLFYLERVRCEMPLVEHSLANSQESNGAN